MHPFLDLPGAVESEGSGVAAHYGAPFVEQRALASGEALVDLSHHGVVTVTGADRLSWLDSMTSQKLTGLAPGESAETLLLDPNGRIQHVIRVTDDGETTWLLVDAGAAQPLFEFLNRMRFALRVEVAEVSDDYATVLAFASETAGAATALDALGPVAVWRDPWAEVVTGGVQYTLGEHPGSDWTARQFVFPRADLARVAQAAPVAGALALEALEVFAARPVLNGDVDERALPHEFDWLRTAVHLTKGCYRGQETVAKVHNLGHPPRRLALLHLDGAGGMLPEPGALIYPAGNADARPVGRITRAAQHYEWGGIALALVKRMTAEDAALEVELDGERVAASQQVIVPPSAGKSADIPRFTRMKP